MVPIAHPIKFQIGQEITHVKTGGKYIIRGLPDQYIIEATGEPAYAYLGSVKIWVRCQSEMEDGRFV